MVELGCEVLCGDRPFWLTSRRLGLLANQASVAGNFTHVGDLLVAAGGRLACFFSPQHGFCAEKQANMCESADGWHDSLHVPVYSLYGTVRQPTAEMLAQIDVLLVDLPDVGTRIYTYGITMGLCLEAASRVGTRVVIMDRPNPINGLSVEGNILAPGYRSFVGRYPIPMRHGLTLAELALFIVRELTLDIDLEVIPMRGWRRAAYFPETALPWVMPSPNMPSWETALLYPGMVLLEGTNISEGRGTTLPFQLFGAPFLDQQRILESFHPADLAGVVLRPVCFEPVFDKWRGKLCAGFQVHITDVAKVRPYRLGLRLLQILLRVHPEQFAWLPPPYEYETEKLPIDILLGDGKVRQELEDGTDVGDLEASWREELAAYREKGLSCRIYPE